MVYAFMIAETSAKIAQSAVRKATWAKVLDTQLKP
jgi:hypothetical protein